MKIPKRGEIFQKILQIRIKFLFFTKNGVKITNFIQKLWQSRKNGKGDNGGDGGGDGGVYGGGAVGVRWGRQK